MMRAHRRPYIALAAVAALALLSPPPAAADVTTQSAFELSLLAGYSDDVGRVHELRGAQRSAVGFEQFARFSSDRGDFLTTDLQVRLSYDSHAPDEDAWALELHNAWLEYKLGLGRKLRLGHFAPAHGLEPIRDTHGTLVQTLAMMDLGFKKDWGLGYSGIAGPVDLDVALQLGSGMAPAPGDDSYLASAQVWTPPGTGTRFGFSLVQGSVRAGGQPRTFPFPDYSENVVKVSRAGASMEHSSGAFLLLAELSAGRDDSSPVGGAMVEIDFSPASNQRLTFECQVRLWDDDLSGGDAGTAMGLAGVSYVLTESVALRGAITAGGRGGKIDETRVVAQLYYYGG